METIKEKRYLNFTLVDELDIGPVLFRVYENRIFHAIIKEGQRITMEHALKGHEFLDRNGSGRFYNLYEFESFAEMDPEIRIWAAETSGNNYTYLDAVVINNVAQKIIANFYLKFNKPDMPTKIFPSTDKALDWIFSEIERK